MSQRPGQDRDNFTSRRPKAGRRLASADGRCAYWNSRPSKWATHTADRRPRTLPLIPQIDLFTQFARSLRGEAASPLTLHEACRITEIAIKAQEAAETGRVVSLRDSRYRTP